MAGQRGLEEVEVTEDGRIMKGLAFIEHPFTEDPGAEYIAS